MPLPKNPKVPSGSKLGGHVGLKVLDENDLKHTLKRVQTGVEEARFRKFISEWRSKIPSHNVDIRFYPNIPHGVRSIWEANFGIWLLHHKIPYHYEPVTFPLSDGTSYTPDFRVVGSGVWVEVKGIWMTGAKTKVQTFLKDFPEEKMVVLDRDLYSKLTKVPGWIK